MKSVGVSILIVVMLTGCAAKASRQVMAYPAQGQSFEQLSRDKGQCEAWADQEAAADPLAGAGAGAIGGGLLGAGAGAVLGAIAGAFLGQTGRGASIGAALGGASGGMTGAAEGAVSERQRYLSAYSVCMAGRGYTVK